MTRYRGAKTLTQGENNTQKLRTGVMEQWKEILNQGNGIMDRGPKQGTGTTDKATEINNEQRYSTKFPGSPEIGSRNNR
jgi:hypothetical protein